MIKQILLISLLALGVLATVMLVKHSTLLTSKGFFVADFVPYFHTKEGDSKFNQGLDVYQDGIINTLDVLKDRYLQEATNPGMSTRSAQATTNSAQTNESSNSANH